MHSREEVELDADFATVERAHASVAIKDKVRAMTKTAAEAVFERGVEQGLERGEIETLRRVLSKLAADKFGAISSDLRARIEATSDAATLWGALDTIESATSADEIGL